MNKGEKLDLCQNSEKSLLVSVATLEGALSLAQQKTNHAVEISVKSLTDQKLMTDVLQWAMSLDSQAMTTTTTSRPELPNLVPSQILDDKIVEVQKYSTLTLPNEEGNRPNL
jgi:hypothetical protein